MALFNVWSQHRTTDFHQIFGRVNNSGTLLGPHAPEQIEAKNEKEALSFALLHLFSAPVVEPVHKSWLELDGYRRQLVSTDKKIQRRDLRAGVNDKGE